VKRDQKVGLKRQRFAAKQYGAFGHRFAWRV